MLLQIIFLKKVMLVIFFYVGNPVKDFMTLNEKTKHSLYLRQSEFFHLVLLLLGVLRSFSSVNFFFKCL